MLRKKASVKMTLRESKRAIFRQEALEHYFTSKFAVSPFEIVSIRLINYTWVSLIGLLVVGLYGLLAEMPIYIYVDTVVLRNDTNNVTVLALGTSSEQPRSFSLGQTLALRSALADQENSYAIIDVGPDLFTRQEIYEQFDVRLDQNVGNTFMVLQVKLLHGDLRLHTLHVYQSKIQQGTLSLVAIFFPEQMGTEN
jgi:hypothetical protein